VTLRLGPPACPPPTPTLAIEWISRWPKEGKRQPNCCHPEGQPCVRHRYHGPQEKTDGSCWQTRVSSRRRPAGGWRIKGQYSALCEGGPGRESPGIMAGGMVATSLIVWPVAPVFLLMHGKDVTIPKGTEVGRRTSAGDVKLDLAKFEASAPRSCLQHQFLPHNRSPPHHPPRLRTTGPSDASPDKAATGGIGRCPRLPVAPISRLTGISWAAHLPRWELRQDLTSSP